MESLPLPARLARPLGYPRVAGLADETQRSLRAFWLDGAFASIAGSFVDSYYTLYILSLGASNTQVGLVNTLTQLAGVGMSIPGALIADRTGRYKLVALICAILSRAMWPIMILAPWLLPPAGAVWLVVAAWVGIAVFGQLGNAAWTALQADLVPMKLRAGYFASRNIAMQLARLVVLPLAGFIVQLVGEPQGYQLNLGLALALGVVSLYFYSQQAEHPAPSGVDRLHPLAALRHVRTLPNFVRFLAAHAILQFGVMVGGPFIQVYWVQAVRWDVAVIGVMSMTSVFAGMVGMRLFGRLHERLGLLRTMSFGLAVCLLPVLWLGVTEIWQGLLVQFVAGLSWSAYNLEAFNLLLATTPDDHRPQYIAIYTTIVSVVGAIGPILGGGLLDIVGFLPIFSASTILRATGLIVLLALVREPAAPPEESAAPQPT